MSNQKLDIFKLTNKDYQNVLKAIKLVYGNNAKYLNNIAFSDTDVEYKLTDIYPESDIDQIDDKFFDFFQDLMRNIGVVLDEGDDRDIWMYWDYPTKCVSVQTVYRLIQQNYPDYVDPNYPH